MWHEHKLRHRCSIFVGRDSYFNTALSILENRPTIGQPRGLPLRDQPNVGAGFLIPIYRGLVPAQIQTIRAEVTAYCFESRFIGAEYACYFIVYGRKGL